MNLFLEDREEVFDLAEYAADHGMDIVGTEAGLMETAKTAIKSMEVINNANIFFLSILSPDVI